MLAKVVKAIIHFLFRVRVVGDKNALYQDKCLITPNHVSFLDGVLICLFLPVKPVFAVYSTVATPRMIKLLKPYADIIHELCLPLIFPCRLAHSLRGRRRRRRMRRVDRGHRFRQIQSPA